MAGKTVHVRNLTTRNVVLPVKRNGTVERIKLGTIDDHRIVGGANVVQLSADEWKACKDLPGTVFLLKNNAIEAAA